MLMVTENIVYFKVNHYVADYDVSLNLICNTCHGHWLIVDWVVVLAYLEDRGNYCFSPVLGTSAVSTER